MAVLIAIIATRTMNPTIINIVLSSKFISKFFLNELCPEFNYSIDFSTFH